MERKHIVIVEDVDLQREAVAEYLSRSGFDVSEAPDGATLRRIRQERVIDLAVIDLDLPDEDGFSLVKFLRETQNCGIIMLTANDDPTDRIVGLEVGADDFLLKPHSPRELLARIRSILRRTGGQVPAGAEAEAQPRAPLRVGEWCLDEQKRGLLGPGGEQLALTTAEYALLRELANKAGHVLDRDHLMQTVFHRAWQYEDRSMDVLVTRLRRKLEPTGVGERIRSVRGAGYVLNPSGMH